MFLDLVLLLYLPALSTSVYLSADIPMYDLLYGDLSKFDFYAMMPNDTTAFENTTKEDEAEKNRRPVGEYLAKLDKLLTDYPLEGFGPVSQDLSSIEADLKNLTTRRMRSTYDNVKEGYRYYYDDDDYYDRIRKPTERRKKTMLVMINLQFLIHTRMKVKEAVGFRVVVMKDKRYRLGYLFGRLRKLLTEQRKLATAGEANRFNMHKRQLHDVYTMLRIYERVARYDVDLRDTAHLIATVYAERNVIDKLY